MQYQKFTHQNNQNDNLMKNLLQRECVSYNQAKRLKELGFDDSHCFAYYNREDLNFNGGSHKNDHIQAINGYVEDNMLPAPTYQSAFRWIREKFGFHHLALMDRFYVNRGFTFEQSESKCLDELIKKIEKSEEIESSI